MPKAKPTPPVAQELIARTRKVIAQTDKKLTAGVRAAVAAGAFLSAVKDQLPHGEFGPWLRKHVLRKLPEESFIAQLRKCQRWMQATTAVFELAEIRGVAKMNAEEAFAFVAGPKGKLSKPLQAARVTLDELIEGRSARDLVLEWKAQDEGGGQFNERLTPEEQTQLELGLVVDHYNALRGSLLVEAGEGGRWHLLPKDERWQFLMAQAALAKNLALHTDWTPAERKAVRELFTSITSDLK